VIALRPGSDGDRRATPRAAALAAAPIGVVSIPEGLAVLDYGGGPGDRGQGRIVLVAGLSHPARVVAPGLDRPVGMARLPHGRYVVAETDRGRLRLVTPV